MSNSKKIAVIGGGISGLTAAYYLSEYVKENNLPHKVGLIEATDRLGGKLKTVKKDGFVIETGSDSWLYSKTSISDLIRDVGLSEFFVDGTSGVSLISSDGELHRIPAGTVFGMPVDFEKFSETKLLSEEGKKRAMEEIDVEQLDYENDIAMGEFFRSRFGDELVEKIIEPLLAGIYANNFEQTSVQATFPHLIAAEKHAGSVIKGMWENAKKPRSNAAPQGKGKGTFGSFSAGLTMLVETIEEKLRENGVEIVKNTKVEEIVKTDNGYSLKLNCCEVDADAVILSTPHTKIAEMLPSASHVQVLSEIGYASLVNVIMAFPASAVEEDFGGSSFMAAKKNGMDITSCTWNHKKWPHTAPEGHVLVRCYVKPNGLTLDEWMALSDEELARIARHNMAKHMKVNGEPLHTVVTRWRDCMPLYTVGHKARVASIREENKTELPGVYFASSSFDGIGMPDCIASAKKAVGEVIEFIG